VAVSQSNYLPWKGYFDLIHDVDLFVFYDDVQFTKNDWRNRNRVKGPNGAQWLTIPVGTDLGRRVCDVEMPDARWQRRHLRTLEHLYGKAPYFGRYRGFVEDVYLGRRWHGLSELNQFLTRTIATEILGITTGFRSSCEFATSGKKQERLLSLLAAAGAETYVSGPAARAYLDPRSFAAAGIHLVWKDYAGYPEYRQFHPPFDHQVTILDLLFHVGPEAPQYVWGWRERAAA
jgi:hypothetical protein